MRLHNVVTGAVIAAVGAVWAPPLHAIQQADVVGHSVSVTPDKARLTLDVADGSTMVIEVTNGRVTVNGDVVATYDAAAGAPWVRQWRALLGRAGDLSSAELLQAVDDLGTSGDDARAERALRERLTTLQAAQAEYAQARAAAAANAAEDAAQRQALVQETIEAAMQAVNQTNAIDLSTITESQDVMEQLNDAGDLGLLADNALVHSGDLTVARDQTIDRNLIVVSGDASVFGTVTGNVVTLNGDVIVRRNGVIEGDVVAVNGTVIRAGGRIGGKVRTVDHPNSITGITPRTVRERPETRAITSDPPVRIASLLGMFISLACIGFGFTFFAPRQLDVVSNTVTTSFGKSLLAGLFVQPLLLPATAMLIAGLAITVVGILLIPVAVVAIALAVLAASVGGYLAVARSAGSAFLARRAARGHAVIETPYRSLVVGLAIMLAIWAPTVVLGWVPVVGQLLAALAAIFTWLMVTAGLCAAILSRAGLRATLVRPARFPTFTDEHYWPAPVETPRLHRTESRNR
jgi:hypothetical protein